MKPVVGVLTLLTCTCTFSTRLPSPTQEDAAPLPLDILAPNVCPAGYDLSSGTSRYRLSTTAKTWYDAEYECEMEGTHLIVIDGADTAAEVELVRSVLVPGEALWVGLSDHQAEGTFKWVTGATHAASMPAWGAGQPDPIKSEDCVQLKHDRKLQDAGCMTSERYMCECDNQSAVQNPTWCRTGQLKSCDSCTDDCDAQIDEDPSCDSTQTCRDGG